MARTIEGNRRQRCRATHADRRVRCQRPMHHDGKHNRGRIVWERLPYSRCRAVHDGVQCRRLTLHAGLCRANGLSWKRRALTHEFLAYRRSWEEIGRRLHITRERARQIGTAALAKLRARNPALVELLAAAEQLRDRRTSMVRLATEELG